MRIAAAVLIAASTVAPAAADSEQKLDMLAFFNGHTHSDNVMKIALHAPHKLIVDSIGGRNKEGEFVLIDNVQEEGKPARKRTWVMRPLGPGHFTGTLSDAKGPVDILVRGSGATISYVMKEGSLKIVQQLQMQRDGTVANHAIAKKFGLKFAQVDGTVRRVD